ncbi:glycosyltransferase family 39 protein [Patescibacteria group bacterium]|nr:glycosyltransferase family 39 protein [Patescibacteria group bacterium]
MDKITKILACGLLLWMFILMFFSAWNDSATMDELAHIPSGYSYLAKQDYRLNPEHPPLIKDLSALPLLFLNLNFPVDVPAWTEYINGQWDMGRIFIYESGNDADKIIHFARFPIMLLALLFGWLLFKWTKKLYGNKVGLLTLFFYTMSPTFIAHSRYVTTDLGAAFGFFIGLATFINFLINQTRKNLIIAGIAFGIAQLLKFSLVILAPIYLLLAVLWVILENYGNLKKIISRSFKIIGKLILIGVIGVIIIWPVYQFHVLNYPIERQKADTEITLASFGFKPAVNLVVWLSDKPVLRPIGQYLLGVLMVTQRASGGNTAYFLGTVSSEGSSLYFPLLYLLKEQLAFHILTLIAIIFAIRNIIRSKSKNLRTAVEWMRDNFAIFASMIFIAIYFAQAVTSNLNIGVRHILPAFPFIYFLVARQIVRWAKTHDLEEPETLGQQIKHFFSTFLKSLEKYSLLSALLLWMFLMNIIAFPNYLSYYNEFGGGIKNGYKIATDSNYDWGQDLKRLKSFVDKNNIEKIGIDYFGGGNIPYYFGDKGQMWWSPWGSPKDYGIEWLAVSANTLMSAQAKPAPGFERKFEDSYWWLKGKEPYARAGTSIFIYKF